MAFNKDNTQEVHGQIFEVLRALAPTAHGIAVRVISEAKGHESLPELVATAKKYVEEVAALVAANPTPPPLLKYVGEIAPATDNAIPAGATSPTTPDPSIAEQTATPEVIEHPTPADLATPSPTE